MTAPRPLDLHRPTCAAGASWCWAWPDPASAAARFLADAGAEVTVYDRRPAGRAGRCAWPALGDAARRLALGVAPDEARAPPGSGRPGGHQPVDLGADSRPPSRGCARRWRDAEARGVPLLSEVDLFLRLTRARVLAVTGTKGKTTTTALIGAILEAAGMPHARGREHRARR